MKTTLELKPRFVIFHSRQRVLDGVQVDREMLVNDDVQDLPVHWWWRTCALLLLLLLLLVQVETVGCVYVVVSGMPHRNDDRHVTEIANMAVDIRAAVNGVTMERRVGDIRIQLRIGIHTGQYVTSSWSRDHAKWPCKSVEHFVCDARLTTITIDSGDLLTYLRTYGQCNRLKHDPDVQTISRQVT